MSTTAQIINVLGTAEVSSEVFNSVSSAAKLASVVRNSGQTIQIIIGLRKLNHSVQRLLDDLNNAIAGKHPPVKTEVTPQQIQMTIDNLSHLQRTLDYVLEYSRRTRLTNNSLAAGSLRTLQVQSEAFKDVIDWFDVATAPEYLKGVFDRSAQEKERGELFDFPRVD
jgi:hypothetical protein